MMPESFVTWRWTPREGYRSTYAADTVNVLFRMIRRHFAHPFRAICVTDDPQGIDPSIEVLPLWNDFASLASPHGAKHPSCYRRLRAFAPDIDQYFGRRFVQLDLDTVICGDLTPLVDREEEFVAFGDTHPTTHYNGSMLLMTAGARAKVWEEFDPTTSPRKALTARCHGSDQGWMSYCLGPGEAKWGPADGVYSFRNHVQPRGRLPEDARIVMFHGAQDPWGEYCQTNYAWVREHWR